jgi:hypothetical protein
VYLNGTKYLKNRLSETPSNWRVEGHKVIEENSRLGGSIDGVEWVAWQDGGGAGAHVDDGAPPALHHAREHGVRHPRDGLDVEPYQVAQERLVHLVEVARVWVARAGVVHEHAHVEPPDELPERAHPCGETIGREVQHEGADLGARVPLLDLGRDGGEPLGAAAHEDEPKAGRGEAERERAADPVRGARDDGPRAVAAAQRPRGAEERRVQPQREARRGARCQEEPQRRERRQRPPRTRVRARCRRGHWFGMGRTRRPRLTRARCAIGGWRESVAKIY